MPGLKIDSLSNVNDDDSFRIVFSMPGSGQILIKNCMCEDSMRRQLFTIKLKLLHIHHTFKAEGGRERGGNLTKII